MKGGTVMRGDRETQTERALGRFGLAQVRTSLPAVWEVLRLAAIRYPLCVLGGRAEEMSHVERDLGRPCGGVKRHD